MERHHRQAGAMHFPWPTDGGCGGRGFPARPWRYARRTAGPQHEHRERCGTRAAAAAEWGGRAVVASWVAIAFGPSMLFPCVRRLCKPQKSSPLTPRRSIPIKPTHPDQPASTADCLSRSMWCGGFGGVSRAAKGADCKSAGYAFAGSSPASPTTLKIKKKIEIENELFEKSDFMSRMSQNILQ